MVYICLTPGQSIYACRPMTKCSLLETNVLLLVTFSTVILSLATTLIKKSIKTIDKLI